MQRITYMTYRMCITFITDHKFTALLRQLAALRRGKELEMGRGRGGKGMERMRGREGKGRERMRRGRGGMGNVMGGEEQGRGRKGRKGRGKKEGKKRWK